MASSESSRPTPLGVARARFVDGLARKSAELRGSLALLAATPNEERPREELRRRLHALYASAQVFQLETLASALKDGIGRLDAARDARGAVSPVDVDALASLAATLPLLGAQAPAIEPVVVLPSAPPVPGVQARSTQPGIAPPAPPIAGPPAELVPPRERTISRPPLDAAALALGARPSAPPPDPGALQGALAGSILERPVPPPRSARPPVVSVLVLDTAEVQGRVRALLPNERFEVLGAADPEEALRLARSSAPDVVLVDQAMLSTRPDFIRRLRDDPLTDFVPVVATAADGNFDPVRARDLGAADVVKKPLEAGVLEPMLLRLGFGEGPRDPSGLGGDLTISEIAGRVADEIRRGLVEAAEQGGDLSVPVGDGAEILAATWAAIGRMRAHVAMRSGGRVHFREKGSGPAFLALTEDPASEMAGQSAENVEVSLRERRVIVVDDDPAVVWFFAGLLREAGALVEEATDGAEALKQARKTRPDVVISDILMPEVDGFALLREMQRDPVLSDVPVILLSWKEDFLQRMRELQSGASGYLRKEAGAAQILAATREVLRPRARLEARLRAGGEVRGRLARVGTIALLKTTAQLRPDARVTVRDAWNLFEIDMRAGQLVDVTRTASDGSFSRGARVVPSLLGATEGRFTVSDADVPVRGSVKEPLDTLLTRSAALLGGVVTAVSGKHLALAHKVELDGDVLASVIRASPAHVGEVVRLLSEGHGPRELLLEGRVAPQVLEGVLVDLARQGAVVSVLGEAGEDRIELARRERGETQIPTRTPSIMPGAAPTRRERAAGAPSDPTLAALSALDTAPPDLEAPKDDGEGRLSWLENEGTTDEVVRDVLKLPSEPAARRASERAPNEKVPNETAASKGEPSGKTAPAADAGAKAASKRGAEAPARSKVKDTVIGQRSPAPAAAAPGSPPPPGESPLPWLAGIGLFAMAGFIGVRALQSGGEVVPPVVPDSGVVMVTEPGSEPDAPAPIEVPPELALVRSYGTVVPGTEAAAAEVAEGEGVLLFEGGSGAVRTTITAEDGSARGGATLLSEDVVVVIPAGVYGLSFETAGVVVVRFTHVAAGTTRRIPRP